MQINPILIKDMKIRARQVKVPIFVMAYNSLLVLIAIVMLSTSTNAFGNSGRADYKLMSELFAGMGILQCAMVVLISLIVAAGGYSGERESGTMDMLLMTPIRTKELVNGKLIAAVLTAFLFTFSSLPVMALGTIYGGTDISDIIYLQCILIILSITASCIGLLCSCITKKTSIAVASSLILEIGLVMGPFFLLDFWGGFKVNTYQFGDVIGPFSIVAVLLFSFNPIIFVIRFYDRIMGLDNMMSMFNYRYGIGEDTNLYRCMEEYFPEISMVAQLLLCVILVYFIARLIKKGRNVR